MSDYQDLNTMFKASFPAVTPDEDRAYCDKLKKELKTKSSVILYLTAEGWKRGRIAKGMDIIYQHVRNEQIRLAKKPEAK